MAIALLWVVHPVQTQSVTYIVQRMNSLAGMFFLLSFYLYVRGRQGGTKRTKILYYSGCVAAGILALGSKENAVILPLMLAFYEFYFFSGLDFRGIRRKWPQITIILGALILIALVHLGPNFIERLSAGFMPNPTNPT